MGEKMSLIREDNQNKKLNNTLFNLLQGMEIKKSEKDFLENCSIRELNVITKKDTIEIFCLAPFQIKYEILKSFEKKICKKFNINNVNLVMRYENKNSLEELIKNQWNDILQELNCKIAVTKALLKECTYYFDKNKLNINIFSNSENILSSLKCEIVLQNIIKNRFDIDVFVKFTYSRGEVCQLKSYLRDKDDEHKDLIDKIAQVQNEYASNRKDKIKDTAKNSSNEYKPQKSKYVKSKNENTIIGYDIEGSLSKLSDVDLESGDVVIEGEIFNLETRETKSGKYLYIVDVCDYSGSMTIKFFCKKEKHEEIKDEIKSGKWIKIFGDCQYDKFSKEITIFARSIEKISKEKKKDDAQVKRVELHMHSQMSTMDGVSSVKDIIATAASWGHKAVAITDHGNVQGFPDAAEAAKKNNIKVLYGVEAYLLEDEPLIAKNTRDQTLSDIFVVFDIETTGLNAIKDKITEIGAVKVKNNEIIDEFSMLVNPEIEIPQHIIELTGITNDMVKDAPLIEDAIIKFKEFFQDAVLVAHNAPFDVGFIKNNLLNLGIGLDNSIIDTLTLSRQLMPDLKRHKLNIIAKKLGVTLNNHHRAVDDSIATANIFNKFVDMLRERDVEYIKDIDRVLGEKDFRKLKTYHTIIFAKNYIGLKNLYKMISKSHLEYFNRQARIPKKVLEEHREGLIIGTACEAGELYSAILGGASEEKIKNIIKLYDYLEIQPIMNNNFLIEKGIVKDVKELENINKKIVELGEIFDKPVVATCDAHFINPEDEVYRRILMAGKGFSDADNQAPLYFRTTNEMLDEFAYLGSQKAREVVIENTNKVADWIEEIKPIPDGTFPPVIEGAEKEIEELAVGKAMEIYGHQLPEVVQKSLDKELNSIIKNGFSVMYIISQKLVWKSLEDGYLVGSRGSVGSSFVANMTGITEVNSLPPHYICGGCKYSEFITDGSYGCGFDLPDKTCPKCGQQLRKDGYDIPFETFLGFDGDKEPDIDLNFSGDYQAIAHKYTEELFGEGKVYKAGTIGTIAEKTAFGYVKNYMDERGITTTNAEIARLVKGCSGVKRTTGQHPGGIMVVPSDRDIHEFCPIQRPADDVTTDIITTHFDYHSISGRLLKLDILGHDDPTVIKMLEDLTGVDAQTIEIGEKVTMGIFRSTEPLGVAPDQINSKVGTFAIPEFGTKFVRQMLVDTKPTTFSELIRISGLSHGTDVWLNNAQDLVRNGIATLPEVICTRDDIMLYLIYAGLDPKMSFKIMEDVRKGKGLKEEYVEAMIEKNVPDWYIDSCKKIKYMFPKAHAAAYVMMAFRIAWFKVHHPVAFYVTYFTVRADDFDAYLMTNGQERVRKAIKEYEEIGNEMSQKEKNVLTILEVVNEMYARGIKFVPIDIYKSSASKFEILDGQIRPPLDSLQGLGTNAAQGIVEARKDGKFISVDELRIRAKVSKTVIEVLQSNNCLNDLPESNQITFF